MAKMEKGDVESEITVPSFSFHKPKGNPISVEYNHNSTLGYAMNNAGESLKNFSFEDHILFTELNDSPGEVAVLPDILCSHLKPPDLKPSELNGPNVYSKYRKGATPSPKNDNSATTSLDDEEEKENQVSKKQLLFYVNSTSLSAKVPTRIANTAYCGKPLCVIIDNDMVTLKDALMKDGRFLDEVMLYDHKMSEVPHDYKASNYAGKIFNAKKLEKTEKRKRENRPAPGCETSDVPPTKKPVHSFLPYNLSSDFTEEMRKGMTEDARNSAVETLVGPGEDKNIADKHLQQKIKKFGKVSTALPARILDELTPAKKSVGYICSGNVTGTCYLLTAYTIITCQHVWNDIMKQRGESTDPVLNEAISVYFDYLHEVMENGRQRLTR